MNFTPDLNPKVNFSKSMASMIDDIRKKLKNPITFRYHHVDTQTGVVSEFMSTTVEKCDNYDYYSDTNDMEFEQKLQISLLCDKYSNGKNKKNFRKLSLPLRRFISKFTKNKCFVATAQSRIWQLNEKTGAREYIEYFDIPVVDVFFTAIPEENPDAATKAYVENIFNGACRSYYDEMTDGNVSVVDDLRNSDDSNITFH